MYDIIIEGGIIVDGTGQPRFTADLGITGEKIISIGKLDGALAGRRISAAGKIVAPGFIDIHAHSDMGAFSAPFVTNMVKQGVTTQVVGQCGYSLFPILPERKPLFMAALAASNQQADINWSTTGEFLNLLEAYGIGVNFIPLVGHGSIRLNGVGFAARKATPEEIAAMKKLVLDAMTDGVFGISTGLGYAPGCFADLTELVELSQVVAEHGGVYTTHLRNQGEFLLESVAEAIAVGEQAGVSVDISHLKASAKPNWGKVHEAHKMIETARERGVDVICDFYPYTAANNSLSSELPLWLNEGGMPKMLERLSSPEIRQTVLPQITEKDDEYWEMTVISEVKSEKNKVLQGQSIMQIAGSRGTTAFDTVCDLLIEEQGAVEVIGHIMCKDDVHFLAKQAYAAVGSDAFALPENMPVYSGHPRNFGTFPRYLSEFVRQENLFSLEEGIRKMTSLPARFFGITDRGVLKEGAYADIVIFGEDEIIDRSTYEEPTRLPEGIHYVLINGQIQVDGSKHNHLRCGKILRK